jgi:hypothetical protein
MRPEIAAPPPNNKAPARAGNSAGADSSYGRTLRNDDRSNQAKLQDSQSELIGVVSFDELLRRSTPGELLTRVRLHRQYLPNLALPANLQRELGRVWGRA